MSIFDEHRMKAACWFMINELFEEDSKKQEYDEDDDDWDDEDEDDLDEWDDEEKDLDEWDEDEDDLDEWDEDKDDLDQWDNEDELDQWDFDDDKDRLDRALKHRNMSHMEFLMMDEDELEEFFEEEGLEIVEGFDNSDYLNI